MYTTHFILRIFLESRNEAIRRCILERVKGAIFTCNSLWIYNKYQPEIPLQSHREKRIKRKPEREVQEIGQETPQSGREARPPASEEQIWDMKFIKKLISLDAHSS